MNEKQLTSRFNEAVSHHKANRLDRAEAIYRQLAPLLPRNPLVYNLWGQLAEQQARYDTAIQCYTNALRIDQTSVSAAVRLAAVFIAVGRLVDAEGVLRRITAKVPKSHDAWNALGFACKLRGNLAEALGCHQKALELDPKFIEGWCHLGLTFGAAGRNHEALKQYARGLELDPNHWMLHYGRAQSLQKVYRTDEALAEFDWVIKRRPDHAEARSFRLFTLQNLETISREELFAEHKAYGEVVGGGPANLPGYDFSPDRRLRVAVLSADLRTHSCAYFLEPLLRHLNPAEFEVYLYHDHFVEDAVSARLKKLCSVWRNFVGQPPGTLEQAIRKDKPDVLFDLTGHVGNTVRLPSFAKRLAPVQITYLGYPDTSGVANMDFRFTDPVADPVGESDAFAVEKLVRFAPTAWCYQPPPDAPDIQPPPSATNPTVTFGCFNSPTKFTDGLYAAWAEILQAVPNGRLLLKGRDFEAGEVKDYLMTRMAAQGVPLERLDLVPRTLDTIGHLHFYNRVDIALDTFPYNGTTTTCEALWMGRPVVTIIGSRHAARVSASLLKAIGREQWVGKTRADYVRIAAELASDPTELVQQATGLRAAMRDSALLDERGQSARFAAAIRACWRARCLSPQPQPSAAAVCAS